MIELWNDRRFAWTDERIEQLKQLWAKGASGEEIAKEMGNPSRNSIIGKAHRLGLEPHKRPAGSSVSSLYRQRVRQHIPSQRERARIAKMREPKPVEMSATEARRDKARATSLRLVAERDAADKAIAANGGIPFMEISNGKCRWPMTEVLPFSEFRFCGLLCSDHPVYCPGHHMRSLSDYNFSAEAAE